YHLTEAGQQTLADFQQQWHQLSQAMAKLNQGGTT
ncbi:MAG: PadR family transcriptional regulator, partial [Lacticaseibacillus paracasei]